MISFNDLESETCTIFLPYRWEIQQHLAISRHRPKDNSLCVKPGKTPANSAALPAPFTPLSLNQPICILIWPSVSTDSANLQSDTLMPDDILDQQVEISADVIVVSF